MSGGVLEWLTATLADVEREIRAEGHDATPDDYGMARCDLAQRYVIADDCCTCGLDIRRPVALASVEADRAILAEHAQVKASGGRGAGCRTCDSGFDGYSVREGRGECRTVLLVASRYAHRPGYDERWRP